LDAGSDLLPLFHQYVSQDDFRPFLRKEPRLGFSLSPRRARNQGDFPVESSHRLLSL
jgi:hypothetical protein